MFGTLFLAATPIGNPADASSRLIQILQTADIVAAEDSRRTVRLLRDLGVSAPGQIISFYEAVEEKKTPELIAQLQAGKTIVVLSDAGMPTVSDPGYRLVRSAIEANIQIRVLPGPSAVLSALAISGLPTDRFTFEGFLPRKSGARDKALQDLRLEQRTMIFFEAPHRLQESINQMGPVFGWDRRAVICRELTKTHEEIIRGTLEDLKQWCEQEILGEITIVIEGAPEVVHTDPHEWVELVNQRMQSGMTSRDAIADVAIELGVPKRNVYDAVLTARSEHVNNDFPK